MPDRSPPRRWWRQVPLLFLVLAPGLLSYLNPYAVAWLQGSLGLSPRSAQGVSVLGFMCGGVLVIWSILVLAAIVPKRKPQDHAAPETSSDE